MRTLNKSSTIHTQFKKTIHFPFKRHISADNKKYFKFAKIVFLNTVMIVWGLRKGCQPYNATPWLNIYMIVVSSTYVRGGSVDQIRQQLTPNAVLRWRMTSVTLCCNMKNNLQLIMFVSSSPGRLLYHVPKVKKQQRHILVTPYCHKTRNIAAGASCSFSSLELG